MQDMMHCLNPSVLERQRFHLQQQQEMIINNFSIENFLSLQSEGLGGGGEGWPNLTSTPQYAIDSKQQELFTSPTTTTTTISNSTSSLQAGKEKTTAGSSSKKRKPPIVAGDDEEKRMKGGQGNEGEKRKGKREDSGNDSKDYIHVRARRGQATDSHSLAERVRRERISERMKYLQGLVPGCNRITGKAGMLEEIINYVQSLQRQVEFLSMKLAAVNPRLDFNMEALITKEMNMQCNSNMSTARISPEMVDPSFLQFNSLQQAVASCDLDMAASPVELALRKTISALAPTPELFSDSCFNVQRNSAGWDNELHNLYGQAFPFHSLQGNILSNNMKTEMLASIRLFMEEKLIYANAKADDSLQST